MASKKLKITSMRARRVIFCKTVRSFLSKSAWDDHLGLSLWNPAISPAFMMKRRSTNQDSDWFFNDSNTG